MKDITVVKANSEHEIQYDSVTDGIETIYQVALVHTLSRETKEDVEL